MSTATAFDPKTAVIDRLNETTKMYLADLGHIPEDKLGACPMGKARTALEFTAECAGFNMFVASVAAGTPSGMPSTEEREAYYASLNTGDKVRAALTDSVEKLTSALSALDDEGLFRSATTPWGMETTVYNLASMCAGHMMYHDGQINYIQSLYGDDANHWGE